MRRTRVTMVMTMKAMGSTSATTLLLLAISLASTAVQRCTANEHAESWHPARARHTGGGGGGGHNSNNNLPHLHKRHAGGHAGGHARIRSKGEQNHGHIRKKHRAAEEASPDWKVGEEGLGTWVGLHSLPGVVSYMDHSGCHQ